MELRQLRYFVALAEERHFGRAAERLRISTPTLSQQIGVLERRLGVQLVHRTPHGATVTDAGSVLLDQSRHLLAVAERMLESVAGNGSPRRALDIRVGHGTELIVECALTALKQLTDVSVSLLASNAPDALDAVMHGRADAAVVWCSGAKEPSLRILEVACPAVSLVIPEDHRLAELDVVPVRELHEETVALFPRHEAPGVYDLYLKHVLPYGPARPGQVLTEPPGLPLQGMLGPVIAGSAVAPYVHSVAELMDLPKVVLRPIDPPLTCPVELIWQEGNRGDLDPVVSAFLCHPDMQTHRAS